MRLALLLASVGMLSAQYYPPAGGGSGGSVAASSVTAGTFGAGNYVFPGNVTVGTSFSADSAAWLYKGVPIGTPTAPTVTPQGATGADTYVYTVLCTNGVGFSPSATTTITNGNATLDNTNFNRITTSALSGSTSCYLLRHAGGVPRPLMTGGAFLSFAAGATVDDTGLSTSGSPIPDFSYNTTYGMYIASDDGPFLLGYTATDGPRSKFGLGAHAGDPFDVAVGAFASTPGNGDYTYGENTVVGVTARSTTYGANAVGMAALVTSPYGEAYGHSASASGSACLAIGKSAACSASGAVAIGRNISNAVADTVNIGVATPYLTLTSTGGSLLGVPLATVLSGTTGAISGALTAGVCDSGTATVTGVTTSMGVIATPVTYPGDGAVWEAYVSGADTVTVKLCGLTIVTPTSTAFNVRAFP